MAFLTDNTVNSDKILLTEKMNADLPCLLGILAADDFDLRSQQQPQAIGGSGNIGILRLGHAG